MLLRAAAVQVVGVPAARPVRDTEHGVDEHAVPAANGEPVTAALLHETA